MLVQIKLMSNRVYSDREGVDWYDESMGMPKHGQMHRVSKKYYNELKEKWCSKRSKKVLLDKSKLVLFDFKFYSKFYHIVKIYLI